MHQRQFKMLKADVESVISQMAATGDYCEQIRRVTLDNTISAGLACARAAADAYDARTANSTAIADLKALVRKMQTMAEE